MTITKRPAPSSRPPFEDDKSDRSRATSATTFADIQPDGPRSDGEDQDQEEIRTSAIEKYPSKAEVAPR